MGNHVALLLVFMLLLKDGLAFHFSYDSPFTLSSQSLTCVWEKELTVLFNEYDNYNYIKAASFQTTDGHDICSVNLTNCNPSIPTNAKGCFCTDETINPGSSGTDYTYTIKLKKTAEDTFSLKEVQVVISPHDFNHALSPRIVNIGTLPFIDNYAPISTNCTLDEVSVSLGPSSNNQTTNNQTGHDGTSATVKCCATNLIPPYEVKISVNDKYVATEIDTTCVSTTIVYNYTDLPFYIVKFDYIEDTGCERTDSGSFFIGRDDPESDDFNIGWLVGGLVAGVIVFSAVALACFLYKK